MTDALLQVEHLRVSFRTLRGDVKVLNDVNLQIREGEVLGIVGESGSGKSSLALSIIGLLPAQTAEVDKSSKVVFRDRNLLSLNERQMEEVRGSGISMIFQEPLTSLNPVLTVGNQLCESLEIGLERRGELGGRGREGKERLAQMAILWLKKVGLSDPNRALKKYPHELSGGMRQRVMIAIAMASKPSLILADEPTSALDATTQAQILKLIRSLIEEFKTSILFISHDLAVIAQLADRVAVMYAGMVVEEATVAELFEKPLHPYTLSLLASFPKDSNSDRYLETIPGSVPSLMNIPQGCPFHPRCKFVTEICRTSRPELREPLQGHTVACVLYNEEMRARDG